MVTPLPFTSSIGDEEVCDAMEEGVSVDLVVLLLLLSLEFVLERMSF